MVMLASAEGDDAAYRIVGGYPHRHTISGHHLDSEAAHAAAQLRKYLVSLVALHTVKPAAVNRHDRALHVNQIVLAQVLSFPSKIVPYQGCFGKLSHGGCAPQPPRGP